MTETERQDSAQQLSRIERLRLQAPLFHPKPLTDEELMLLAKAGEGGSY